MYRPIILYKRQLFTLIALSNVAAIITKHNSLTRALYLITPFWYSLMYWVDCVNSSQNCFVVDCSDDANQFCSLLVLVYSDLVIFI